MTGPMTILPAWFRRKKSDSLMRIKYNLCVLNKLASQIKGLVVHLKL